MIDAEKLDKAILAQLRAANGSIDINIGSWQINLQRELGTPPDQDDIKSTMRRLWTDGLVHLTKHSKEYSGEYGSPQDDWWFFGYYTFRVSITDQGRLFWNVSIAPIGFRG